MSLKAAGTVLLVGAGKMGMAMAAGWIAAGLPGKNLILVDPNPHDSVTAFAKEHGAAIRADLPDTRPDVIVLAVKPQVMGSILDDIKALIGDKTLVVSIAAGISAGALKSALGTERVVRTMPNTPAQLGKGITGALSSDALADADRDLAEALLKAAGEVIWVEDEKLIDAVTAVSGSGPAYVFNLVEAMAAAGENEGLSSEQAMALARQTVIGAAALLESDPSEAAQLRKNVTSPNGTTQAALDVLMAPDGLAPLMAKAIAAARRRSEELGQ